MPRIRTPRSTPHIKESVGDPDEQQEQLDYILRKVEQDGSIGGTINTGRRLTRLEELALQRQLTEQELKNNRERKIELK